MINHLLTFILMTLSTLVIFKVYVTDAYKNKYNFQDITALCNGDRPFANKNYFALTATAMPRQYPHTGEPYQIQLDVSAKHSSVLVLSGDNEIIWQINTQQPNNIKAIVVTGNSKQKINYEHLSTPIYSVQPNTKSCLNTYLAPFSDTKSAFMIKYINVTTLSSAKDNGKNTFKLDDMNDENRIPISSLSYIDTLPASTMEEPRYFKLKDHHEGLEQAVELDLIRKATAEDQRMYRHAYTDMVVRGKLKRTSTQLTSKQSNTTNTLPQYVILQPFLLPSNMKGFNAAIFYLARGVSYPKGRLEDAIIYDLNDGTCVGLNCGFN